MWLRGGALDESLVDALNAMLVCMSWQCADGHTLASHIQVQLVKAYIGERVYLCYTLSLYLRICTTSNY
jgi:hypothetical protein